MTMRIDSIKKMGIALDKHLADDGHCWLWCTNQILLSGAGYDVVRAWGYEPKSVLSWIKPRYGYGPYLRNQTEHVIFATRGRSPVRFRGQGTWFYAPVQDHSHKPEEIFDIIERVSRPDFLELFARRPRAGWDRWGLEVRSDIDLIGFPVPDSPKTRSEGGE
jgi:N6-adenosine-specific RNA methylase IME4